MNILIYDNEWSESLKFLPYKLFFAYSEDEVYELTFKKKFDFYIFDFEKGYGALKNLRESEDKTIAIFLSNIETFEAQKKAYTIADEFFKKRVTYVEEIKIKIEYYIKKYFEITDIIKYKNIYFNLKLRFIYKNSKKIDLTNLEYDLLILFFKNKKRYISKEEIIDRLNITEGSLKVKISNLRKLGFEIENTRNLGYKLKESR